MKKSLPENDLQVWECALKLKKPDATVHGVHVVAQLINEGKKYIVLVKQYRIPINAVCIEFPGGEQNNFILSFSF